MNLRFLDVPLSRLTWFEEPIIPLATDGRFLYYDSRHIINRYKSERNATAHDYLHAVLHCVFRHMFVHYSYINRDLWNLACDIAVEFCISELDIRATAIETKSQQQQVFDELKICNPKIAKEFAVYYDLFNKYRSDYQVDRIVEGKEDATILQRAKAAKFDERLALIGLLLDVVEDNVRTVVREEMALIRLKSVITQMRSAITIDDTVTQ